MLELAARFYQQQLDHCPEVIGYLRKRGVHDLVLIRELGIGYAPGGSLRQYLTGQGHSFDVLLGLVVSSMLTVRMRSINASSFRYGTTSTSLTLRDAASAPAFADRFPARNPRADLYAWEKVQHAEKIILVEGLFDYAVLRQAGFSNVTCSLGTHLNPDQFGQLCEGSRSPRLCGVRYRSEPERPAGGHCARPK